MKKPSRRTVPKPVRVANEIAADDHRTVPPGLEPLLTQAEVEAATNLIRMPDPFKVHITAGISGGWKCVVTLALSGVPDEPLVTTHGRTVAIALAFALRGLRSCVVSRNEKLVEAINGLDRQVVEDDRGGRFNVLGSFERAEDKTALGHLRRPATVLTTR